MEVLGSSKNRLQLAVYISIGFLHGLPVAEHLGMLTTKKTASG